MYYSYILRSLKDGRYYYGSAEDVDKRLIKHNSGQVRSTKGEDHSQYILLKRTKVVVWPFKGKCFINRLTDIII